MAVFKVGDEIVMLKSANREYSLSQVGSVGIIQQIIGDSAVVYFTKLTGSISQNRKETFTVSVQHMEHVNKEFESISAVCRKVREMDARKQMKKECKHEPFPSW